MKIGFFPGSFDPFINGHLNVVRQSAKKFDKVILGIGINPLKLLRKRRFNRHIMKETIEKVLEKEGLKNVEVIIFNSFFLQIALEYHADMLIRGIRNEKDRRYEKFLAKVYKRILGLDTLYIQSEDTSATQIMKMLKRGENIEEYLPQEVWEMIKANKNLKKYQQK